jgi:hypothetical protein
VGQTWTTKTVLDLAPDASSASAARSCANASKWVTLGRSETALWGEFQGSGSKPYQTQVDLREPAFKCSCPSRKFPCKHGLGIMLVLAERADKIPAKDPPAWVADWLEGREAKAQKRDEKAAARAEQPVDREAQAKRAAAREAKVRAGLDELGAFLRDVLRQGLAMVQSKPVAFFEKPAARLVDAQAAGLARLVRNLSDLAASGEGWQSRLLAELSRLHLVVEAYRRIDQFDPAAQAELRAIVGWSTPQEELLALPGVKGRWVVAARTIEQENHLTTQRTWLIERESARPALVFHFAAGGASLDKSLIVGTEIGAELVYFPAATPLRAIVKSRDGDLATATALPGASIAKALEHHAAALAASPWLSNWPMILRGVAPRIESNRWLLRDAAGAAVPLVPQFRSAWELLAVSGGSGIDVMGEWDGRALRPMAAVADGQFIALGNGSDEADSAGGAAA